ncbi:hypothetical protein C2S53_008864 [Perilla frutescens var. hirtella]|uniref:DUF4220 domain-containing protein n=1 Tax=Perilla frutescens var. hirtella TaxID=608512 RepID=A0AAD4JEW5_PERFH|nr:hypothetical protein C2S53_008864 [Perilla frutescens var. hirtella]
MQSWAVSDRARRAWDEWNLRTAVLLSLFFQVVLIVSANLRRRWGSTTLTAIIWSSYLLADWMAAFAVGLISSGQTNDCPLKTAVNKQLAAFWAPFLLLHLGGPDAITAFSLEDNELWIRHLLGLLIQLLAVLYVLIQSLPNDYWIPTVLLFFAGACKYAERTVSLYRACLGNFKRSLLPKPDPGPNYAQLMAEFSALDSSGVPVVIKVENEPEKEPESDDNGSSATQPDKVDPYLKLILEGYDFFKTFKGLIVDHMFSFHERDKSRRFFLKTKALEAFQVMEVELNFIYDVLYTKMGVVHCWIGYICRLLCIALIATCFQQFASLPHHGILPKDKSVSYILLVGAVVLEMVGLFKLVLSDWVVVSFPKEVVSKFLIGLPFCKRERRWSNTMFRLSFINFCLKEGEGRCRWVNIIADFLRLKDTLDEFRYKEKKACEDKLKEFVFSELKAKAEEATTREAAKKIYSARGEYVLKATTRETGKKIDSARDEYVIPLKIWASVSDEVEYDESLLLWHIATELCYFTSDPSVPNKDCELCKILSDYMLYLLVMRPTLMSTVAGIAQIRFQDTCEEAKKFFKRDRMSHDQRTDACKKLIEVIPGKTEATPKEVKGDRSKSLLFDACILARDLKKLGDVEKWKLMSRVWVELMSYGASRCRPSDHARQLSQGGEFITFVWLLMVHFGLGEQFRIESGHARAKLLVDRQVPTAADAA